LSVFHLCFTLVGKAKQDTGTGPLYSTRGSKCCVYSMKPSLEQGDLNVELLGRGFAWLDTGTHESLLEAAQFVETVEKRQGYKIACLEEIAFNQGWLSKEQMQSQAMQLKKNGYGAYLLDILEDAK